MFKIFAKISAVFIEIEGSSPEEFRLVTRKEAAVGTFAWHCSQVTFVLLNIPGVSAVYSIIKCLKYLDNFLPPLLKLKLVHQKDKKEV
jgi:hypothetical protein